MQWTSEQKLRVAILTDPVVRSLFMLFFRSGTARENDAGPPAESIAVNPVNSCERCRHA